MKTVYCKKCGHIFVIEVSTVVCKFCGYQFKAGFLAEDITNPQSFAVLKIGDIVKIVNSEHVWYNQIALICDVKPLFYRIEIFGQKVWMPQHWVGKIDESNNID